MRQDCRSPHRFQLIEKELYVRGDVARIAGVDEAGRGPWAGPVVAAAVVLSRETTQINGLNDSKKLTSVRREKLCPLIKTVAVDCSVGIVSHGDIDQMNILQATRLAMIKAIRGLKECPQYVLIDGNDSYPFPFSYRSIIKGDSLCLSIAAASIVAKVTRDHIMQSYHERFPQYQFNHHKGYGTKIHQEQLKRYGPCEIHRRSFAPVKRYLAASRDTLHV